MASRHSHAHSLLQHKGNTFITLFIHHYIKISIFHLIIEIHQYIPTDEMELEEDAPALFSRKPKPRKPAPAAKPRTVKDDAAGRASDEDKVVFTVERGREEPSALAAAGTAAAERGQGERDRPFDSYNRGSLTTSSSLYAKTHA
jgi:hypothetical protein